MSPRQPKYEVRESKDGEWYVRLRAANNEVLMHSETYTRKADAERAVRYMRATTLAEAFYHHAGEAQPEHDDDE
jgi:uncharacterized protein YegP (UPF0339 family)